MKIIMWKETLDVPKEHLAQYSIGFLGLISMVEVAVIVVTRCM